MVFTFKKVHSLLVSANTLRRAGGPKQLGGGSVHLQLHLQLHN